MTRLTFLEFFSKWNGKLVDLDGFPKNQKYQCLDLAHLYHIECLGLTDRTILAAPIAKEVYTRFPNIKGSEYFTKIPNMWWTIPKQGDYVIWREPFGPYKDDKGVQRYAGHIAIINEANMRRFSSFDQNYADRTGGIECRLVEHDYRGVMGFLRFKGTLK